MLRGIIEKSLDKQMKGHMKYAVIELSGKQYRVTEGLTFTLDRLDTEVDKEIINSQVLLISDDAEDAKTEPKIGTPYLEKASVTLKVVNQFRDTKIRVATYKSKSRYRKIRGHRQHQTTVLVTKITG